MKEYITKNRAKQFVCGHCNEVCSEEPCELSDCDWMAFIDSIPAADVAPVVRCQDCVYAHPLKESKYDYLCHYWNGHSCNQNQFCSQGKRKQDEK